MVGKPDDWYLTDFNLGDDLLDAKESTDRPDPGVPQRRTAGHLRRGADLLTTHSSNLGYLPSGSDATVRAALDDPNAFRGNKMAQLKQATDQLRAQIDEVVASNRAEVVEAIEGRKAEIEASAFYAKAAPDAQESVLRRVDQMISRLAPRSRSPSSARLGLELRGERLPGAARPAGRFPQGGDDGDGDGGTPPPPKQTVSVKTISATGVCGVLETEDDVDRYLDALRAALVQTLNDGKRISL